MGASENNPGAIALSPQKRVIAGPELSPLSALPCVIYLDHDLSASVFQPCTMSQFLFRTASAASCPRSSFDLKQRHDRRVQLVARSPSLIYSDAPGLL